MSKAVNDFTRGALMLKKLYLVLSVIFISVTPALFAYAYPQNDVQVRMAYFSQGDWPTSILACQDDDATCRTARATQTIKSVGCSLTSMAMLYGSYGFGRIPGEDHLPMLSGQESYLNPATFNNYLAKPIDPLLIGPGYSRGFNFNNDIDWYKTTGNFFYIQYFLNGIFNIRPYFYVIPNYDCAPLNKQIKKKNGKSITVNVSKQCFSMGWNNVDAMTWLDHDIQQNEYPPIMQIQYFDNKDRKNHTHFVVIAGYDPTVGYDQLVGGAGGYRDYNPGINDVTTASPEPKALNGITQYAQKYHDSNDNLVDRYQLRAMIQLYRFRPWWSQQQLDTSLIDITLHSPVEINITDPDGNLIGYDPDTKEIFLENPMSSYYVDTPVTPLDGADEIAEPTKKLTIVQPRQGNYILNLFGTGSGPYAIDMVLIKPDGTFGLATSLTGTATPNLLETYRVTYSPTGEASLSQTNQSPIANAGANQTGEQSYEITLDGSASHDPDGDPLIYTWSFQSKPNGSGATLSDIHAVKPTFTPDLAGTYILQLVVNDHFGDSAPSVVTINVTPLNSRISVTPNFSQPWTTGSGIISFDVNNTGRVAVTAGTINISLSDPAGTIVAAASKVFNIGVGGSTIVNIPVTIPMLQFGTYSLTYTQSDETRTGTPVTVTIPNSPIITFSLDKTIYRVRDTANLSLYLMNTGKFNLTDATLTVSMPDAGYTNSQSVTVLSGQSLPLQFTIQLPSSISAGQHNINASLALPSGSTIVQNFRLALQDSVLWLDLVGPAQYAPGDTISLSVQNQGAVDTTYTTQKMTLTDNIGNVLYQGNVADSISAGEIKSLIGIQIPPQISGSMALLSVILQDTKTGKFSNLNKSLVILSGLRAGLVARTDKDVYMKTEAVTAVSTLSSNNAAIDGATLNIKVNRYKPPEQAFTHFLPKEGWYPFSDAEGVAVAADGSVYITESPFDGEHHVLKFDNQGNFVRKWGSTGSDNGQFSYPQGIAVAPDGSVYVVDSDNNRIQKFDNNGVFITKWGSTGSDDGQFSGPSGIAIGSDGSVNVADYYNHRIQKFDSNGNFISKLITGGFPTGLAFDASGSLLVLENNIVKKFDSNGNLLPVEWGGLTDPLSIAVDPAGFVYILDYSNNRIVKFDNDGQFISAWGCGDAYDIAVSPDGFVYAVESLQVQKFDSNGNPISSWGTFSSKDGSLDFPIGVALDSNQNLYVADYDNNRIQKFDNNGNFVGKWGNYGSGSGQFSSPVGIAVGPDGSVYVADTQNNRIQKFDNNGNFIIMWGTYGSGDGQFSQPNGVAIGPNGEVYIADTFNNRVQKFDADGNFVRKWYGALSYPRGIAVGADGSVYVADSNSRIQKFDDNGSQIMMWGSYGLGNGQFYLPFGIAIGADGSIYVSDYLSDRIQKFDGYGRFKMVLPTNNLGGGFSYPAGITVGSDGSVYVADADNGQIQRMAPFSGGLDTIFESNTPIIQSANNTLDYITNIGDLNASGKFYLESTLKNSLGQLIASSEYPFYIVGGNTSLIFSADKKIYKQGDTVTISGQVKNLASVDAVNVNLAMKSQPVVEDAVQTTLYSDTINIPAGGSYPFTFTTAADQQATMALIGTVSQDNMTLGEVTDQYVVTWPNVSMLMTAPAVVNRNPFNLDIQITNTGSFDAQLQYSVSDTRGNIVDNQSFTILAGETKQWSYAQQISRSTTYRVYVTGDVTLLQYKTVSYGEVARITFGAGSSGLVSVKYPEGKISIPVTVTNLGLLDTTVTVTYSLAPSGFNQTSSYFLPFGASVNDTLTFDALKGDYQLTAISSQPFATAQASFTVLKEDDVAMSSSAGTQGANGLIPVTVNIANNGSNDLNGSVSLVVMNSQEKAVWRGEIPVTGLITQTAQNYVFNVETTGLLPGAYAATSTLYNSSGQQLAMNQTEARTSGPIFEITAIPTNLTFTQGTQAAFAFAVKNTGTLAGTATLSVTAADMLNQSVSNTLQSGEQKIYAFNFAVPENEAAKNYAASYALTSTDSQGATGQAAFNVAAVKFDVTPSLDKQVYNNGDTAVLNLAITKQSDFQDGTFLAIVRYGSYYDMQTFTSGSQATALTFNVPLAQITGNKLSYGIYFQSGGMTSQNSVRVNTAPMITDISPTVNSVFYSTASLSAHVSDGGLGISTVQYQLDGGQWIALPVADPSLGLYSISWMPSAADNGLHTVTFRAIDTGGNIGITTPIAFAINTDTVPPVTTLTIGTPQYMSPNGTLFATDTTLFTFSATDDLSGVAKTEYQINGGAWTIYAPFTLPTEGVYTISYRSTDNVGNIETTKQQTVSLDQTPPMGSIMFNGGALYTNNPSATLTLTCTDAMSGCIQMQLSNDDITWFPTTPFLVTMPWVLSAGDGQKNVFVQYMDGMKNMSSIFSAGITLDTTPPALNVSTLPDGSYTNNATLNIAGTITDNALDDVAINGTSVTVNPDGTFSQAISLATGTNTITIFAVDKAANSVSDARTITLDQTAPFITILNPADNSVTNQVASMVTGTIDKTAAIGIAVNDINQGSLVTDATFSVPIILAYGQNTIQVTATDQAGNVGTAKRTVTLDNGNPSLSITYPVQDITTSQNQITLSGQVTDLTPVTVTISVDGNVFTPAVTSGSFSQVITFTVQKTYQINVTAVDEAGNQSLAQRNVIYNAIPQNFGVFGATGISMSGGYVDSYDSTHGTYNGTHGTNVSVGTNSIASGAINLSGGAVDYGDAYVGQGGNPAIAMIMSGGSVIYGVKKALSMPKDMTPRTDPGGGTPATVTNGTTLTSGTYRVSSINLSGSGTATMNGNVILYMTGSINLSGSSQIVILPGGSLTIYLNGSFNVSGGSIVNQTLDPHKLMIYGTSTCTTASYSGSSALYGAIYAPAARTTISGGSNVYGAVIGNSITLSGGSSVHYDESLGNVGN